MALIFLIKKILLYLHKNLNMVKLNEVAKNVRVKLNSNFIISSLSKKYLACEPIIFIADGQIYNDSKGEYIFVKGGSHCNSGAVYLDEIDLEFPILEFPINDKPLYSHESIDYNKDLTKYKNEN